MSSAPDREHVLYLAAHRVALRQSQLRPVVAELVTRLGERARAELFVSQRADAFIVGLTLPAPPHVAWTHVAAAVERGGLQVIDPLRLTPADRSRFMAALHTAYERHLFDPTAPLSALEASVRPRRAQGTINPDDPEALLVVRFARGEAWQLGRLRGLDGAELQVATTTPPHAGDVVQLRVGGGKVGVEARAAVLQVIHADAAGALGVPGFTARILIDDPVIAARVDSLAAHVRATAAHVLGAPPRRREARYSVCWPVTLHAGFAVANGSALDLSLHGMFVATDVGPSKLGEMAVDVPIDDGGEPLHARSRVARTLGADTARARGLTAGVGLELDALAGRDQARFSRFVQRVGRRSLAHVLIAASADRAGPIVRELISAGYGASHTSSAEALVGRLGGAARPPELVLVDASLLRADREVERTVEWLISARRLPHARISEDTPSEVRALADLTLLG